MGALAIVIACLIVSGFGYPKQPTFPFCQSPVCNSGATTGYQCHNGVCDYVCSNSLCHGTGNTVFSQKGMNETWGIGALGAKGCNGSDCGFWSGCINGKCKDFYDFKQCHASKCLSGPFEGYECTANGQCRIVCRDDVCHLVENYGKSYHSSSADQGKPEFETEISVKKANSLDDPVKTMTEFVENMDPNDLEMLMESTPNVDEMIMGLDSEVIKTIVPKLPNASKLMKKLKPETIQHINSLLASKDQKAEEEMPEEEKAEVEEPKIERSEAQNFKETKPEEVKSVEEKLKEEKPIEEKLKEEKPKEEVQVKEEKLEEPKEEVPYLPYETCKELGDDWVLVDEVVDQDAQTLMNVLQSLNVPMFTLPSGSQIYAFNPMKPPQSQILTPSTLVSILSPTVLQSMLLNIPNLKQLMLSMDPILLHSALKNTPGISGFASSTDPQALQSLIKGLPTVKSVVASMDPNILKSLVMNISNLDNILYGSNPAIPPTKDSNVKIEEISAVKPLSLMAKSSIEMPGVMDFVNFNDTKAILSTVPSIPLHYANALFNADPAFVRYVVEKHQNLNGLLTNMNGQTLQYIASHVPAFGKILSKMNSYTLEMVFDKMPKIAEYLESLSPEVVQALVAKLPSLAKYTPIVPIAPSLLKQPKLQPRISEEVSTTVATEAPAITEEEVKTMKSKIPLIDLWLKFTDSNKMAALRELVPDYPKIFANLEPSKLEAINSHLSNISNIINAVDNELYKSSLLKLKESGSVLGALVSMLL
ncbi:unnamed protein product [Hydatigera taeniaeformis]|uniref:Titin n=1 Tax=Hydatigena taeniaeformis TaxID=6205 RepID=A0A0R3WM61_HYDTA|nr:unnamed protein product [Hydatigera taeniaeformis]